MVDGDFTFREENRKTMRCEHLTKLNNVTQVAGNTTNDSSNLHENKQLFFDICGYGWLNEAKLWIRTVLERYALGLPCLTAFATG